MRRGSDSFLRIRAGVVAPPAGQRFEFGAQKRGRILLGSGLRIQGPNDLAPSSLLGGRPTRKMENNIQGPGASRRALGKSFPPILSRPEGAVVAPLCAAPRAPLQGAIAPNPGHPGPTLCGDLAPGGRRPENARCQCAGLGRFPQGGSAPALGWWTAGLSGRPSRLQETEMRPDRAEADCAEPAAGGDVVVRPTLRLRRVPMRDRQSPKRLQVR